MPFIIEPEIKIPLLHRVAIAILDNSFANISMKKSKAYLQIGSPFMPKSKIYSPFNSFSPFSFISILFLSQINL